MRKTYIIPALNEEHIDLHAMIAMSIDKGDEPTDPSEFETKRDRGSDSYNVWNEDWSK